jgi:hypothetical protein
MCTIVIYISTNILLGFFFPGNIDKKCNSAVHKARQKIREDMKLWLSECISTQKNIIWFISYTSWENNNLWLHEIYHTLYLNNPKVEHVCKKRMFFLKHFLWWVYVDFILCFAPSIYCSLTLPRLVIVYIIIVLLRDK